MRVRSVRAGRWLMLRWHGCDRTGDERGTNGGAVSEDRAADPARWRRRKPRSSTLPLVVSLSLAVAAAGHAVAPDQLVALLRVSPVLERAQHDELRREVFGGAPPEHVFAVRLSKYGTLLHVAHIGDQVAVVVLADGSSVERLWSYAAKASAALVSDSDFVLTLRKLPGAQLDDRRAVRFYVDVDGELVTEELSADEIPD